ncbi:MAG: carboxypeptidase-like regulatory domain-containing protein [Bacteroidota bacterium]|nr:carboxypeptidase-like regulatory domain-containing protein [Bacteroidota bacterium]
MWRNWYLIIFIFLSAKVNAQSHKLFGKITNAKLEPLAFVSVEVRETKRGTITKEDGTYRLWLDEGKYDLVVSMIGYKPQVLTVIIGKTDVEKNIIMENDDSKGLAEVVVKGRDQAEEIIRNVIRHKEEINAAHGAYSCNMYIKAVEQDSSLAKKRIAKKDSSDTINSDLKQMAMTEVALRYDYESPERTKEERIGVTRGKKADGLFYLSTTDGDFNFYNNLVKVPAVSEVPILSPVSYSGLLAYKFKTLAIKSEGDRKIFTISVKPRQLSNATVEGEITITDSSWVILHTQFNFPKYHLPEYDFFKVEQNYSFVKNTAWMITQQKFTYFSKAGKKTLSGNTTVTYKEFQLNKTFDKKYFGAEVSTTAQSAYEKDTTFWQTERTVPLTQKEVRYIHYKDSIYTATHATTYLDSMDRVINKITLKKLFLTGLQFNDHHKERRWYIQPITAFYQPFQFGGTRINLSFLYTKIYQSKKSISLWNNLSYGIRNRDVNGSIRFSKLYNPFNRSYFNITLERNFQYIFQGDAWINMLKRSNIYLNNGIGIGHSFEMVNGLYLFTDINMALRRSVSNYKTNPKVDSLFGNILTDNQAVSFEPYNALYGQIRLEYTPHQRYIREPKEKIILGSKWPSFYTTWRKGIPGILNSKVEFDYLEFGITQEIKLGLLGVSNYTLRTGSFLSRKDLRLVDYKFQRQGDPLLFLNPNEAFQSLDSTFPVFNRFYEAHYVHNFNGAIINKIPLLKKLQLREVAGAGFLIAPERNLRYVEGFAGIERVIKWPFNPLTKFKLGVYIVGSAANKFHNPVQFKIGITSWDKVRNKWY